MFYAVLVNGTVNCAGFVAVFFSGFEDGGAFSQECLARLALPWPLEEVESCVLVLRDCFSDSAMKAGAPELAWREPAFKFSN